MLKKDILKLIQSFEMETWKYSENVNLDNDMMYIYSIGKEIKNVDEENLKPIYDKLIALMGMIRFKYGFESVIINSNSEFENLKNMIESISLNSSDIISQYNYVLTVYSNCFNKIKNVDFIENSFVDIQGKEGVYLAIESLKSLISNENYKQLLGEIQINEILVDCVKLNNSAISLKEIEFKYKEIIKKIWEYSLSNKIDSNDEFRVLFSNISGGDLIQQAEMLVNRPSQSSCSMISSDFIATYGSEVRKIGFIYPNNSEIIMASAYDLSSNVFGAGVVNKDMGTILATPQVIEEIGKTRAIKKGDDLYSSSCYNEILVNAKPCGIVVIGLGENDLNVDYQEAKMLSLEMNLPIYYIDIMKYKENLSESDKYYIAFHSLMSYFGLSMNQLIQMDMNDNYSEIYKLIDIYKEQLVNIFLKLKKEGNLNKDNMCQLMSEIIGISKIDDKSR